MMAETLCCIFLAFVVGMVGGWFLWAPKPPLPPEEEQWDSAFRPLSANPCDAIRLDRNLSREAIEEDLRCEEIR